MYQQPNPIHLSAQFLQAVQQELPDICNGWFGDEWGH